jgi:hypothetical protein
MIFVISQTNCISALRIPSSYLPTGPDDGANPQYSDGRVGTAYIQELRFNKYCERLQEIMMSCHWIHEFKLFLKHRGVNIDTSLFNIKFTTPQNFAAYRQIELDAISVCRRSLRSNRCHICQKDLHSKRFLGIIRRRNGSQNQQMWTEEHGESSR